MVPLYESNNTKEMQEADSGLLGLLMYLDHLYNFRHFYTGEQCYCFPFLFLQSGGLLLKDEFVPGGANYSRTSMARTLMARLPRLFRTRS